MRGPRSTVVAQASQRLTVQPPGQNLMSSAMRSVIVKHTRRHLVVRALAGLLLALLVGCARDPIRPYPGEPTPPHFISVDDAPEWSHDARTIAYRRRFVSADGPAGLYIIDANGGPPRWLLAGGIFSPDYLRFSPDDRFLACVDNTQLTIIDLGSGAVSRPLYAENGVSEPDWSPDGRRIVYRRWISSGGLPPESLGVHILDLDSGLDSPVYYDNQVQFGGYPIWAKDGIFLVTTLDGSRSQIRHLSNDRSTLRVILSGTGLLGNMRRYVRTARGLNGMTVSGRTDLGTGSFYLNYDGTGLQRQPPTFNSFDAYSPDGAFGVGPRLNPADSLTLLYVFDADDIAGTTQRQLTHYSPPSSNVADLHATASWNGITTRRP